MSRCVVVLVVLFALLFPGGVAMAAAPPASTVVRIMPLGDSITDGPIYYGTPAFAATNGYDWTAGGYRPRLYNPLANDGYRVQFIGPYESGVPLPPDQRHHAGRASDVLSQIDASLPGYFAVAGIPDVVLVIGGTNDQYPPGTYPTENPDGAPARLDHLLATIQTLAPNAWTLIQPIPEIQWTALGDSGWNQRSRIYNQQIPGVVAARQAAGQRVRFVDAGPIDVAGDGAHPSALGYQQIAAGWLPALAEIVDGYPCALGRRIGVNVTQRSDGLLSVTVTTRGRGNVIAGLKLGLGAGIQSVTAPRLSGSTATFMMRRSGSGPATQAFTVTDICGDWPTLAGVGTGVANVPAQIIDGQAKFGMSLVEFYRQDELYVRLARQGIMIPSRNEVAQDADPALAFVDPLFDGSVRWIAECPDCKAAGLSRAEYVWLQTPLMFCLSCGNVAIERRWRPVLVPPNRLEIERLLLARPDPLTRSWRPGETLDALVVDNVMANGGGG